MATLKGQGAWTQVPLIVHCSPKSIVHAKNPETGQRDTDQPIEGRFLEIQVDQSMKNPEKVANGQATADTNPYLNTKKENYVDKETGEERETTSHRVWYQESQYQAMAAAGKTVSFDEPNNIGKGELISVKADLFKSPKGAVLVNTKSEMTKGTNPHFGKNTLDKQRAVTQAARDFRDAQRASEKEVMVEDEATIADPTVESEPEL